MVLSEAEAEAQLAHLRREREALDRAIADLSLYLELGRRLTAGTVAAAEPAPAPPPAATRSGTDPTLRSPPGRAERAEERDVLQRVSRPDSGPSSVSASHSSAPDVRDAVPREPGCAATPSPDRPGAGPGPADDGPPDEVLPEGVLSDGVLARRYGRALIEAALAALEEAGRPLHAAEILAVLTARGFTLPGHDAVAALNTRLWKRSGAGGPLRRMGDAVYALAGPEEEP